MTLLEDSPYDSEHAFSGYIYNLRNTGSLSWYSETATANQVRDYVWGLMNLQPYNVRHSTEGYAQTSAETVLFIAAEGARGSILTCFPMDSIGTERINNALSDEWEATKQALSAGSYVGNAANAKHCAVVNGQVHEDFEGSPVFEFINGATVVRLDG